MPLIGKTLLITAGPTREYMDPVRFISNASSGKMGYALAQEALRRGAKVILISGPTHEIKGIGRGDKGLGGVIKGNASSLSITYVEMAQEMLQAVLKYISRADAVIMAAAVTDYRPAKYCSRKLKKTRARFSLPLVRNPDILSKFTAYRLALSARKVIVGFALETDHWIENAQKKLQRKKLDMIVANRVSSLGGDKIKMAILTKDSKIWQYPVLDKTVAANKILDKVEGILYTLAVHAARKRKVRKVVGVYQKL